MHKESRSTKYTSSWIVVIGGTTDDLTKRIISIYSDRTMLLNVNWSLIRILLLKRFARSIKDYCLSIAFFINKCFVFYAKVMSRIILAHVSWQKICIGIKKRRMRPRAASIFSLEFVCSLLAFGLSIHAPCIAYTNASADWKRSRVMC